ncbi:helix-turn-helix domain-containing protein [Modestobacter sp. Leaf380]|uniref:helix-turn-helix domain-containing protein n=1 Tax=Modestobacter sp. Leaf380 TaxID=1736356 RepID=UPI0009E8C907|nr:helix-turn-helix domain-containing protein [Modestobacter sp. Leaf380]
MPSAPLRRELLDTEQAAAHLGRDINFVRRLVQHREINFYRVGRRLRFDPIDLNAFLASCRVEALPSRRFSR